ncbi:hypothetical protein J6590_037908 [Homalodisca vitripennis]|nr:hypothetical protein J6590_037908 [Homalodisca vitripennis]
MAVSKLLPRFYWHYNNNNDAVKTSPSIGNLQTFRLRFLQRIGLTKPAISWRMVLHRALREVLVEFGPNISTDGLVVEVEPRLEFPQDADEGQIIHPHILQFLS